LHIPDGYLSPATCAVAFAAAIPFWSASLRKVEQQLGTRLVPILGVFSAFSFVVMMFNLPLPGGTTGHAVGMGIATVVLGPWAASLAISIALLIQAILFGDGGITALGANCFNMAIVGTWVAYVSYRVIAGRAALGSRRRVVAAAVGGYLAINAAAVLTAIELGVQPLWFHGPSGVPLYAPYPLHIAIPAMMIGHLGLAGIAEAVVSGGLLAYLQRTERRLLQATAPGAGATARGAMGAFGLGPRRLLAVLGILMILSPLGVLATGVAWGEWGSEAFTHPEARQQMARASGDVAPPQAAPVGLERLGSLWRSPIPDYEVPYLQGPVGYVLSATVGTGLIILLWLLVGWVLARRRRLHTGA